MRQMHIRVAATLVAAALVLVACGPSSGSATPEATGTSSLVPPATSTARIGPSSTPATGQTDTAWGRIWDSLPAGFPTIPGSTPSEEAAAGPASAVLAIQGTDAKTIAMTLQTQLEAAGYTTEALNGPAEDGGFVLESTGNAAGCKVKATVAPLGGLTLVTILYGAACPNG